MPWISFDFDGTLADWPFGRVVFPKLRAEFGPDVQAAIRAEFLQRFASGDPVRAFDWDDTHETVRRNLNLSKAFPKILEFAQDLEFPASLLYDDVPAALERLRTSGWKIALGTNGFAKYQALPVDRLGLVFDATLGPDTTGFAKPQPGFFTRLRDLTHDAQALEGLVHVGDILTQDVLGANRAGVLAAWVWRDMPETLRAIPPLARPDHPSVIKAIESLVPDELELNGRINEAYDSAPRPDYVVADLLELVDLLELEPVASGVTATV